MLRALKYVFLLILGIVLLTVAFANREPVTLELIPQEFALLFGGAVSVELPLFLVIFGGIVGGLLIGFVWEWLREARYRSAASQHRRDVVKLEREVTRLRDRAEEPQDDVIALLEKKTGTR
jgi:uncharacterized integral membrane protein